MSGSRSRPWQNRPSVVACWNQLVWAFDISGSPVTALNTSSNPIVTTSALPVCIPRACRLTRLCFTYFYQSMAVPGPFPYEIHRSANCGDTYSDIITAFLPIGNPLDTNCYCVDVSQTYDECDVWFSLFNFLPVISIIQPRIQVVHHFELR